MSDQETTAPAAECAPVATTTTGIPVGGSPFRLKEATVEWNPMTLAEGEVIQLDCLKTISLPKKELFFPDSIYIRVEMCQVFRELTKKNRKERQILIGSPGVGKSILLFLVALHRAVEEGIPTVFFRKTKNPQEFTSVFFMKKMDDSHVQVFFNRTVQNHVTVYEATEFVVSKYIGNYENSMVPIQQGRCLLYIDGLHESDPDLQQPHHYLSTSGGYDAPHGESARHATIVVLGGWSKVQLSEALTKLSVHVLDVWSAESEGTLEDGEEMVDKASDVEDEDDIRNQAIDYIFYHTGGRIREVLEFIRDPTTWKDEKEGMIGKIKKERAMLSIIETKGSGDTDSPDRVRTMFRTGKARFFGSCLQIVDSQYFARLLHDRCSLEEYYNAYTHAKNTGLSSAAGCHFEELVHRLFYKCPRPIDGVIQNTGPGAEGVKQLKKYRFYWVPSVPNFANINAALLLMDYTDDGEEVITLWCFQYTVSKDHPFNAKTFRSKFLRPVLQTLQLNVDMVAVKILFIVPSDVIIEFRIPTELLGTGWATRIEFVDCNGVDTLQSVFERLDFIPAPVQFKSTG